LVLVTAKKGKKPDRTGLSSTTPAKLPILEEDEPDPDPEDDPDPIDPSDPEMDLAQALQLLAKKIGRMPSQKSKTLIKPCVPDTFDGSNPNKLEVFLFQCQMYLAVRSNNFLDDESKVTFVLSYLKGSPQDWFQSELNHAMTSRQLPDWFATYRTFMDELQHLFGPRDPITNAMNSLESLKPRDSRKATRYTIDFNRYARKTGWNKQVLSHQFYKNLPDRLKDEIAHIRKPTTLKTLQTLLLLLISAIGSANQRSIGTRKPLPPTPIPLPPISLRLPTTVPAINSLAVPNRTTDSSNGTKINRSQPHRLPLLLKISQTRLLTYLVPTGSSLLKNANAVWTTSSASVAESLAIWFWTALNTRSPRLRPVPQPCRLPPPLWAWEKLRQFSVLPTAGGLRLFQWCNISLARCCSSSRPGLPPHTHFSSIYVSYNYWFSRFWFFSLFY